MPEISLTIRHESGLHARPLAAFVQTAKQFESDIEVVYNKQEVNAKNLLGLLTLGVGKDTAITLRASGSDADRALNTLKRLVENNFGEGAMRIATLPMDENHPHPQPLSLKGRGGQVPSPLRGEG